MKAKRKSEKPKGGPLAYIAPGLRPLAVRIAGLHADDDNVRLHGDRNLDAIAASLERFGQQAPVVFVIRKRRKVVVKGNGVLAAARTLGWRHLAATPSALKGHEATAYAIADNRTADLSEFDAELLAAQLQELEEAEFDIEDAGFNDEEMQDLIERLDGDPVGRPVGSTTQRKRGERTATVVIGHLKFELPQKTLDRWLAKIETKVTSDPDRVVAEIKRRLKMTTA